jgi:hypothetical protein
MNLQSSLIRLDKPDYVIDCSTLASSVDVYTQIHAMGNPKMYCYAICFREGLVIKFLKIGESAPDPGTNTSPAIGERIKRQVEHFPGWDDKDYYSSHGDDFWNNTKRETKKGNLPSLTKDDLLIGVWNLDVLQYQVNFWFDNNKTLSTWVEGYLCERHKELNEGKLPILNIKDPTRNSSYRAPVLDKDIFEKVVDN